MTATNIRCEGTYATEADARSTNASLSRQGMAEAGGTNCPICIESVELVTLLRFGRRIDEHTRIAYQDARDCPDFD